MRFKLIVFLFCFIILSLNVSAFEFDNYYTYNETSRTATFKNGLTFGSKIAEIKLNTPYNMRVAPGYNYVFELELNGNVDYSDFVRGIYVHDRQDSYNLVNKNIDLKFFNGYETKYRDVNGCITYGRSANNTQQCIEFGVINTTEYQVEIWDDLLPRDIKQNDHLIVRGYTNIEVGERMEWYIDFFGAGKNTGHGSKGVKEWSSWTADLNVDISSYYRFDEQDTTGTGVIIDAAGTKNGTNVGTSNTTGILETAYDYDGSNDRITVSTFQLGSSGSVSLWFKQDLSGNDQLIDFTGSDTINIQIFNGNIIAKVDGASFITGPAISQGVFYNVVFTWDGTDHHLYLNTSVTSLASSQQPSTASKTMFIGIANVIAAPFDGTIDELGIWDRALNSSEVEQLFNNGSAITFVSSFEGIDVTLNSPINDSSFEVNSVDFNWTITPTSLNITNWTFSTYFENGTLATQVINTSINTNESLTVTNNQNLSDGSYVWNVEACGVGVDPACDLSGNNTFLIDTINPAITITNPPEGFIVTQFNESIDLNWTITEPNIDTCSYTFDFIPELALNDSSNLNNTVAGVMVSGWVLVSDHTTQLWNYQIDDLGGGTIQIKIAKDANSPSLQGPLQVLNQDTGVQNVTMNLTDNGYHYFEIIHSPFASSIGIASLFRAIGPVVNVTDNNIVNCSLNTTVLNYPNDNPNNMSIAFFVNDTVGNSASDNVTIFKSTQVPLINLTSPVSTFAFLENGDSIDLNWTITTNGTPDVCFFEYNSVNTTVNCSLNSTFTYVSDVNNITFHVNDTLGNSNQTTNSWTVFITQNNITFNANTFETSRESFILNLSTSPDVLTVEAVLNYAGTQFTAQTTCVSTTCIVETDIDIPLLNASSTNITNEWFFEISLFTGTNSSTANSSIQDQNVSRIFLEKCNATFVNESINFSLFDETAETVLFPMTWALDTEFWLGSGSVRRSVNLSEPSINNVQLCISPANLTYFLEGQVEYNKDGSVLYNTRNYFFQNDSINSTLLQLPLGLLLITESTSFILKVRDAELLPLRDVLIFTERFYTGLGDFRVVQVAKTDDDGTSIGFFQAETADYRFIIRKDNEILLITPVSGSQKVVGEDTPFTLTFTIGGPEEAAWAPYEPIDDLNSSIFFNVTSQIATFTYIDSSGNFTSALFNIFKTNLSAQDELVCTESSTQSSAIISCNMSGNSSATYIARGFITRGSDQDLVNQESFLIQTFTDVTGRLGLFLGWILIIISAFTFRFNEIAGIISVNATMIFANIIGLVAFGPVWISAWIAMSIFILVVLER